MRNPSFIDTIINITVLVLMAVALAMLLKYWFRYCQ